MDDKVFNEYHDREARDRLSMIAESRTTPSDTVAKIIASQTGEQIMGISRIIRGEVNEVYEVSLGNGTTIILRISHNGPDTFNYEKQSILIADKAGVPVPTIVAVGEHQSENNPVHYAIQEKLPGRPFDLLLWSSDLPIDRAKSITVKAGEVLARLHSIKTTGWGAIEEGLKGEHDTVLARRDRLRKALGGLQRAFDIVDIPGLPDSDDVYEFLEQGYKVLEGNQTLIHGDYGPKHIFVDEEDNITGVIDWEQSKSADPAQEFARWNFWFEKGAPTSWLKEGHERLLSLGDNYNERFKINKIDTLIWTLLYFTYDAPSNKWAQESALALKEAFR